MPDGGLERDAAAERVAHDVGLLEPQVPDQRRDVVGHEPDVDRPVDVGGSAVSLEIDCDHLALSGECRQERPEHLTGPEPAMEQDRGSPLAVDVVVEADPVDVGVTAGALCLARPVGGRHGSAPPGGCLMGRYPLDGPWHDNSSAHEAQP